MDSVSVVGLTGDRITLDAAPLEKLKSSLRGALLVPGDEGYDKSRTVWNAMIDRKPALVVRCAGVADIRQAVTFAHTHRLLTAVKGGGHNIAGNAVCDGGLLIDLSNMRTVAIDPIAAVAHVEPGATLGDFDHECQAFGLATPVGINSTTGIAGLTLGGGFGWLSRKYGMTVDNLLAADVMKGTDWARGFFKEATPYATGGVYVNFLTDDEPERVKSAYGPGYDRLVAVKNRYDPGNLFRMNQNIRPSQ